MTPQKLAAALTACIAMSIGLVGTAQAIEFWDGRVQMHGFVETQLRGLAHNYRTDDHHWRASQWAFQLNIETEVDIAPDGFGPFNLVSAYARVAVRYDCIYTQMCKLFPSDRYYGDRVTRQPRNLANSKNSGYTGFIDFTTQELVQPDRRTVQFVELPPGNELLALANPVSVQNTFGELLSAQFTGKLFQGSIGDGVLPLGPLDPTFDIDSTGPLADKVAATIPLPLRPQASGLYVPSRGLRDKIDEFDSFDQNFTQRELEWNRGASQQQTKELKEAYFDIEMFDGSLFFRIGRQTIVWGKTELFRSQDQFNPQDFAISTLPSLEESRIPLWAARMIWSLYDIGPLEDVRIELAANIDHFEPTDLGDCGEPYTIFLVCLKSAGLFLHGAFGTGLAGEIRPPDPWNEFKGLEIGARVEFRWGRFSVAISDFWGYSDFPHIENFHFYERKVNPRTGRPLDVNGRRLDPDAADIATRAIDDHPSNRQLFDSICSATLGLQLDDPTLVGVIGDALDASCAITLFNNPTSLLGLFTLPEAISFAVAGGDDWNNTMFPMINIKSLLELALGQTLPNTVELDTGAFDGGGMGISAKLTNAQEALLGCGPFYHGAAEPADGSCHVSGFDLFNAEASVILQNFPQMRRGSPVATRWVNGQQVVLPGARSPFDYFDAPEGFRYDPEVDGCIGDLTFLGFTAAEEQIIDPNDRCDGSSIVNPDTGQPFTAAKIRKLFRNELAIASLNAVNILGSVGVLLDEPGECVPSSNLLKTRAIAQCTLVRAIFRTSGVQRPEMRAGGNGRLGRSDFVWAGGSQAVLEYQKRNVLGISVDFAEDYTKTGWGIEFSWFDDQVYGNAEKPRGFSERDTLSLTVSVDRPTFVNFLNANRTIFFNSQWFFRYITDYEEDNVFAADGPVSVLGTFTAFTGFYQDRLLTFLTVVHDIHSHSGGLIFQVIYRFNERFSTSVGMNDFYGDPRRLRIPINQFAVQNNGNDFTQRLNFQGVSPVAERSEVSMTLRYTF